MIAIGKKKAACCLFWTLVNLDLASNYTKNPMHLRILRSKSKIHNHQILSNFTPKNPTSQNVKTSDCERKLKYGKRDDRLENCAAAVKPVNRCLLLWVTASVTLFWATRKERVGDEPRRQVSFQTWNARDLSRFASRYLPSSLAHKTLRLDDL